MGNLEKNEYYKAYKRIRKTWNINPVERVVKSKKEYNRTKIKKETQELINNESVDDIIDIWDT